MKHLMIAAAVAIPFFGSAHALEADEFQAPWMAVLQQSDAGEQQADAAKEDVKTEKTEAPASQPEKVVIGTGPAARTIEVAGLKPEPVKTISNGGKHSYKDLVAKHARAHGVPVALAQAVVHVESRYNPRATGKVGEVGLMQLKLQTARGMGYKGSRAALYHPETNIKYGMKYLAKAYELAGGDTCGTILRYNAGHYAKRMSAGPRRYCNKVKALIKA